MVMSASHNAWVRGLFSQALPRTRAWPMCRPVVCAQHVGAHTVEPAYARVNCNPWAAIRSRRGVRRHVLL